MITTVYDLNATIKAGDTITDLFLVDYDLDSLTIPEFIEADTGTVDYERYNLTFTEQSQNDSTGFAVVVSVKLSNGESYSDESTAVFFR